jgi:hypothetical protein
MTLGAAAAAQGRLIVWFRKCSHQVEPDPAEMAERYGVRHSKLANPETGTATVDATTGNLATKSSPARSRCTAAKQYGKYQPERPEPESAAEPLGK